MSIVAYLLHRLKDFFVRPDDPEHYRVQCWKCGTKIIVTTGLERQQLEIHFATLEHQTGERQ